jgi:hypothetical protein
MFDSASCEHFCIKTRFAREEAMKIATMTIGPIHHWRDTKSDIFRTDHLLTHFNFMEVTLVFSALAFVYRLSYHPCKRRVEARLGLNGLKNEAENEN